MRLLDFFEAEREHNEEYRRGDDPGDGIGEVEHKQTELGVLDRILDGKHSEDREDPDDAERAGADERDDHRNKGFSNAAKRTASHLHNAAKKIGEAEYEITHGTEGQNALVPGSVNSEKLRAEEIQDASYGKSDRRHDPKAMKKRMLHTLVIFRAHILCYEGQRRVVERVLRCVNVVFQI